jgi:hypothetical protein
VYICGIIVSIIVILTLAGDEGDDFVLALEAVVEEGQVVVVVEIL